MQITYIILVTIVTTIIPLHSHNFPILPCLLSLATIEVLSQVAAYLNLSNIVYFLDRFTPQ